MQDLYARSTDPTQEARRRSHRLQGFHPVNMSQVIQTRNLSTSKDLDHEVGIDYPSDVRIRKLEGILSFEES